MLPQELEVVISFVFAIASQEYIGGPTNAHINLLSGG